MNLEKEVEMRLWKLSAEQSAVSGKDALAISDSLQSRRPKQEVGREVGSGRLPWMQIL